MNVLRSAIRELFDVFNDDPSLTVAICVAIALCYFAASMVPAPWRAAMVFVLMAGILIENVVRSARRRP